MGEGVDRVEDDEESNGPTEESKCSSDSGTMSAVQEGLEEEQDDEPNEHAVASVCESDDGTASIDRVEEQRKRALEQENSIVYFRESLTIERENSTDGKHLMAHNNGEKKQSNLKKAFKSIRTRARQLMPGFSLSRSPRANNDSNNQKKTKVPRSRQRQRNNIMR